jgi:hypothetical protein
LLGIDEDLDEDSQNNRQMEATMKAAAFGRLKMKMEVQECRLSSRPTKEKKHEVERLSGLRLLQRMKNEWTTDGRPSSSSHSTVRGPRI